MPPHPHVCVIIAAKNASATIERAVRSALAAPEVGEVIVVDDGSSDETGAAACKGDDGKGRLHIIRFEQNQGPAAARNAAIAQSKSEFLAILDADDFFLPGRFSHMMAEDDWDFIADNIVFVPEEGVSTIANGVGSFRRQPATLTLEGFIRGNISQRGKQRGEIGFLKPVMRRSFLDAHKLRYNETLRLGEDYDLYVRALAAGARYKVIHSCGYGAVVRADSLSGKHRTLDLKRLYEADRAILQTAKLNNGERKALILHEKHIRARYEQRHFLDLKNQKGPMAAIAYGLQNVAALPAIITGIAADKLERFAPKPQEQAAAPETRRFLLPVMAE